MAKRQSLRCAIGIHKMVSTGWALFCPYEFFKCARCGGTFERVPNIGYRPINTETRHDR